MPEPIDPKLLDFSSEIVKEGLAFVERHLAADRRVKKYEDWPVITWSNGLPEFNLFSGDPPIDYKDTFSSLWLLGVMFGRDDKSDYAFDFEKLEPFRSLREYVRTEPNFPRRVFPRDMQLGLLSSALKVFLEHAIDRYIHVSGGTSFSSERFLEVYLPLEAGLLLEDLPIEIHVPILLARFPSDEYDLGNDISIVRMSEPMQLARVYRDRGTHHVNAYLMEQAGHALVLRDHTLPNTDYRQRYGGYELSASTADIVDMFFASLRIATPIETGYAQVLFLPLGWAHHYAATLPPLTGTTVRRYPPSLEPVRASHGELFPSLQDADVDNTRALFQSLMAIKDTHAGERLRLAIKRLNRCYMREDQEDAILDATIGLEILLSDGETQEITHKLALRLGALCTVVPGYDQQASRIFRSMKKQVYPYRSAVVHGDERKASKTSRGTVKLAIEYLGLAVRAVAAHPEYLDPGTIDHNLLLGRGKTIPENEPEAS
jgi:hypothetical protein